MQCRAISALPHSLGTDGFQEPITAIRTTIARTGTSLTRSDGHSAQIQRFGGHVLQVSGAQALAAAGVSTQLIQLLGRWTSVAIQRYTQNAALVVVPDVTKQVINDDAGRTSDPLQVMSAAVAATSTSSPASNVAPLVPVAAPTSTPSTSSEAVTVENAAMSSLRDELALLKQSVLKPTGAYILRHQLSNPPSTWRTRCGWSYGTTNFWRVTEITAPLRKCRKCFGLTEGSDSESRSNSGSSSLFSSSDDSSD